MASSDFLSTATLALRFRNDSCAPSVQSSGRDCSRVFVGGDRNGDSHRARSHPGPASFKSLYQKRPPQNSDEATNFSSAVASDTTLGLGRQRKKEHKEQRCGTTRRQFHGPVGIWAIPSTTIAAGLSNRPQPSDLKSLRFSFPAYRGEPPRLVNC